MKSTRIISLASVTSLLLTGTALAVQPQTSIASIPDQGQIAVSGTVASVSSGREFTLRDNSGSINIKLAAGQSVVLKQGDNVTVTGAVERPFWGLMGKDIAASTVDVHKDLATALSDAITKTTGIAMNQASTVKISQLPASGLVQINGTVDSVSDSKKFTVRDSSGSIDIAVKSDENVAVSQGAQVSVTGYVNQGLLGKNIDATHVIVAASGSPANLAPAR